MKFYLDENKKLVFGNDIKKDDLKELIPNTTEASTEKHLPVVKLEDSKVIVSVGSVTHPMSEEHLISDIIVETDKGVYSKKLTHLDKPEASFDLIYGEKVLSVYEYCNLHGLWETKLN